MSVQVPLLEVQNIVKHFPIKGGVFGREVARVQAVNGVSFSMPHGHTLGLVGESGCGKSTLGRTILRLYEPTEGQVRFEGKEITGLSANEMRKMRRQMQIIFQDPFSSLNPRMTVGSILSEPFIIHGTHTKKQLESEIPKLLDTVGLPAEAAERYPHEFSGGQRQRIGIARAIALRPKLIVADEPVSALDVSIQSQILNLLSDLRTQFNLSYLFIAHDLAVIEHISHIVAVMYLGRIVEYASSESLYKSPSHPYTRALISAIPVPEVGGKRDRIVLNGDVPSPISPPSGCAFNPRCSMATAKCRSEAPQLRNIGTESKKHLVSCHNV